jgi:hypothetical protein
VNAFASCITASSRPIVLVRKRVFDVARPGVAKTSFDLRIDKPLDDQVPFLARQFEGLMTASTDPARNVADHEVLVPDHTPISPWSSRPIIIVQKLASSVSFREF